MLGRVVSIWETVYGPDTEDLARARMNYALLLASSGQIDAALKQLDLVRGTFLPGAREQTVFVLHEAELAGRISREQAVDAVLRLMQDSQTRARRPRSGCWRSGCRRLGGAGPAAHVVGAIHLSLVIGPDEAYAPRGAGCHRSGFCRGRRLGCWVGRRDGVAGICRGTSTCSD